MEKNYYIEGEIAEFVEDGNENEIGGQENG